MLSFIVRRLLALIPLMLIVSFLVYSLVVFLPGDPAVAIAGGTKRRPSRSSRSASNSGLDDPLLVRYGRWLKDAVQGDLGESSTRSAR